MSQDIHNERILVLDFGSQYTQLIARRVRELGVFCEILPFDVDSAYLVEAAPQGIILSGGPESVTLEETPRAPAAVFELGCPVLGICYGMQTMAEQLGGAVIGSEEREFGHARLTVTGACRILDGLQDHAEDDRRLLDVWMSHGDRVTAVPAGFSCVGTSLNAPIAAMADETRGYYGVQFHPEVTHSRQGQAILRRFVRDVCDCSALWTAANIVDDAIEQVRSQVGDGKVILGLSGGVDSSVVAALLHRAIGDQLVCVFVDNGLLRLGEGDQVMEAFAQATNNSFDLNIVRVDAEDEFLSRLAGVADPETKRKIIGQTFIEVFEREAKKVASARYLAQGTIYPDVIESAASRFGKAHVIKSHHNVGGLPERMDLELVEPLRELFKDEVRRIGLELGLPAELIHRHPFPGPGLGVRILGEIRKEYAELLREADAIFIEELRAADWYQKVSQAFVVFMPVKSVGVVGDARRYEYVVALRAVETIDFMTARWAELPHALLAQVSNRIINEIAGISRVVYDISSKPPATIEWE
ncbi:MAG: glutamine-hydrolyzing GMP synthase [Pseudomonadales bacterium]|jgi:GMP synthase (glutamine-hydrolysing)|nr:glutamine-hydrolyzing GMP synthase [Pseudomonadales bacterium]